MSSLCTPSCSREQLTNNSWEFAIFSMRRVSRKRLWLPQYSLWEISYSHLNKQCLEVFSSCIVLSPHTHKNSPLKNSPWELLISGNCSGKLCIIEPMAVYASEDLWMQTGNVAPASTRGVSQYLFFFSQSVCAYETWRHRSILKYLDINTYEFPTVQVNQCSGWSHLTEIKVCFGWSAVGETLLLERW